MVGCVLNQLKTLWSSTFLALKKVSALFKAKNVEFHGLYPIHIICFDLNFEQAYLGKFKFYNSVLQY